MTITTETTRTQHDGDGVTTQFSYKFRIISEDALLVIIQDDDGNDTIQVLNTDYTVTGVQAGQGSVIFTTPPLATDTISIIGDPPVTQLVNLTNAGQLPSETIERALDRLTNLAKRSRDLVERALALYDGDTAGEGRFDAASNRISGLADPIDEQDAATRAFVAAQIASAVLDPAGDISAFASTLLDDETAEEALATLGGGTKGIELFETDVTGEAWDALTFSAWLQSWFSAATSLSAAQAALGVTAEYVKPNELINGDFQIWQDGAYFINADDDTYTADQWKILSDGDGAVSVIDSNANTPQNCKGNLSISATLADTKWALYQCLENRDTETFAGGTMTLSFWAKCPDSLTGLRAAIIEWNGSIDVTTYPIAAWNGAAADWTLAANWTYPGGGSEQFVAPDAEWNQYKIEGIPISGIANVGVLIGSDDVSFGAGAAVQLTGVKLEENSVATPFIGKLEDDELRRSQRYFNKTFRRDLAPADGVGLETGEIALEVSNDATSGDAWTANYHWRYPIEMMTRPGGVDPDIVAYNPGDASPAGDAWYMTNTSETALGNVAEQIYRPSVGGVAVGSSSVGGGGRILFIHLTAKARFF